MKAQSNSDGAQLWSDQHTEDSVCFKRTTILAKAHMRCPTSMDEQECLFFVPSSSSALLDAGGSDHLAECSQSINQLLYLSARLHPRESRSAFHSQIETNWSVQSEREATLARRNSPVWEETSSRPRLWRAIIYFDCLWWKREVCYSVKANLDQQNVAIPSEPSPQLNRVFCGARLSTHVENCDCFSIPFVDSMRCVNINDSIIPTCRSKLESFSRLRIHESWSWWTCSVTHSATAS